MPKTSPEMVRVSREDRNTLRLPLWPLVRNKAHELVVKARGRRISGQGMIGADADAVRDGFAGLTDEEFAEYNFPQRWVERRTIPRALDGRVPARDAVVLDLGCGPGTSTEIIARFADPSWSILAFDLTPHLVQVAKDRAARAGFVNRDGAVITPRFFCQDIGGTLRRDSKALPNASADFAISGGVVGLYMNPRSVTRLAYELRRVLKPGAFAALDAGPAVGVRVLKEIMARAGFRHVASYRSIALDPRPKLVFERGEIPDPEVAVSGARSVLAPAPVASVTTPTRGATAGAER